MRPPGRYSGTCHTPRDRHVRAGSLGRSRRQCHPPRLTAGPPSAFL